MDQRARFPPGIGNGRGGNPNFYGRGPPPMQQHHQQPPQGHLQQYMQRHSQHHNQQLQHQQWLGRNQVAGEAAGTSRASEQHAPPAADDVDFR
jgi:ATP-dependent RNA helicase DDX6/DHH1